MSNRETRASKDLTQHSFQQLQVPARGPRGRGGSRTPSPSPRPGAPSFFPPEQPHQGDTDPDAFEDAGVTSTMATIPPDATPEQLRLIAEEALTAANRANAALQAVINASAAVPHRRKKPELPAFDRKNIEIWIKRIESAYQREEIVDPKDKFAFLESVIGVDVSPKINEFLFGEATAVTWSAFLQHLRNEFGLTKTQRVATIIDGIKRDGRRPSQLLSLIKDRSRDITLDDVQKELVLRELPPEIRRTIQDRVDLLDAEGTAELADTHFDQNGRQLNSSTSSAPVNEVAQAPQDTDNSDIPVNAVGARFNNNRGRGSFPSRSSNARRYPSAPSRPGPASAPPAPRTAGPNSNSDSSTAKLCMYHKRYGDEARTCQTGCSRFDNFMAGNGRGGRR